MATLNTRDPVQGLIDYVKDVKPFHTKILEVWVEYIYTDAIEGQVEDEFELEVGIALDRSQKVCKYGFDTQPWNAMLLGDTMDDIVPGTITYNGSLTVKKSKAVKLYFDHLQAEWRWLNGLGPQPTITSDPTSRFYLLSIPHIMSECRSFFGTLANSALYWFDPSAQKLFKKIGYEWHEQPAYISTAAPSHPIEQDLWVDTSTQILLIMMAGEWVELHNMHTAYIKPNLAPEPPYEWFSNWDMPYCRSPFGETVAYTFVEDKLEIDHGSEIFLSDGIRAMVFDPTGEKLGGEDPLNARIEYPIKYRTTITQDASGRYKITRSELSIINTPTDPDIINHPYTIALDGMEFEGFGIDRQRKGVRLNEMLVWRFKSETEGMQLVTDAVINRDTYAFRVSAGQLITQRITANGLVDIDCPFANGQIVYFTSTDDLPTYNLMTQDSRRPIPLMRYTPYRIVRITNRFFSLALLKSRDRYDPVTGNRIQSTDVSAEGYKNGATQYEIDQDSMGAAPYLNFVSNGHGQLRYGIGYPVPFIETRSLTQDHMTGSFKERTSSTTDSYIGNHFVPISDVLINVDDHGTVRNAFVIEGNYQFTVGEVFKVSNSSNSSNDGDWTITKATQWSNKWLGVTSNGTLIPSIAPTWWNPIKMGDWPTPVKRSEHEIDLLVKAGQYEDEYSEYTYFTVTTVGVSGAAPSTQFPHGAAVFSYYAFGEPSLAPNVAATAVTDSIQFGSSKLTQLQDGSWAMVLETGTPGVSVRFVDAIMVQIQEQLEPNEYGIPTIGSFDIHYYDQQSLDAGDQFNI